MLSNLRLQDFRCFKNLNLCVPEDGALFIGDNAQGKTSILEAICLLIRLQSPRTNKTKMMVRSEQEGFGVSGECWGVKRTVRFSRKGLSMQVDDEEVHRQNTYFENGGLVVWMGNSDLDLVRGSGEVRRRYLDFVASQLDYQYRVSLSRYRKALKSRNLLLKNMRNAVGQREQIDAFNSILIVAGDYITAFRAKLVESIEPHVSKAQLTVSEQKETASIEFISSAKEGMEESLKLHFDKDCKRGQTTHGPHRDDLTFKINNISAVDFGSEGQQRTLALALKLGQGELLRQKCNHLPIYLLDDIFGELDYSRRNAVMEFLPSDAQMIVTTTHIDWLNDSNLKLKPFSITNGEIAEN